MRQNGYATVVMLLTLLSAGAFFGFQRGSINLLPVTKERLNRLSTLAHARQSLLHYASTYSDLYGPRGAGPGHLPCPDLDAFRSSQEPGQTASPFVGDSPDPPCGNDDLAYGYLPRHVSLTETRYAFHTEAAQNIWYRVATSHINNPINRIVNSSYNHDQHIPRKIVRLVSPPQSVVQQDGYELTEQSDYVSLSVTDTDILFVTSRRVFSWFERQYYLARQISCEEHGSCWAVPEALQRCRSSVLSSDLSLLWVMSDSEGVSCQPSFLEQTELSRHWFSRNLWHQIITVHIDDECRSAHYLDCQLDYQSGPELFLRLAR